MSQPLRLRIILHNPPSGTDFGLQKGSGSKYETVQVQQYIDKDLIFDFTVAIKGNKTKDHAPALSGPFVQGPAAAKFVYIDIGTYAGQTGTAWSRRLKIPLTAISWDMAEKIITNPPLALVAIVPGMGKDGGPACGSVKFFDGWHINHI